MGKAAPREADKVDEQGLSLSVVPGRDIHIDKARRGIAEHVALEGLAFDREAGDGADRSEISAHKSLASADVSGRGNVISV
jgi:hypothetical protein